MRPAVNIKRLLRYGPDVDARDYAETPELKRLFSLYDANVKAGACGACGMELAIVQTAKEFGRDYNGGPRQCSRKPPRPAECDERVMVGSR